jgi:hypothetical protein
MTENEKTEKADLMDSKIFVIYYKRGTVIKSDELYQPLMCGGASIGGLENFLTDNVGEQISSKNSRFSELSGLYWVWKNTNHEVIGTCHYRRFYSSKPNPKFYSLKSFWFFLIGQEKRRSGLIYTSNLKKYRPRILLKEELSEILEEYDAILPKPRIFRYSIREHYRKYHDINDMEILKEIIGERCPEYLESFEKMLSGNILYANNMFIMKNEDYQKFMSWWFDLIFAFEARVKMDDYRGYQSRIIGFIAERLLTLWFTKNQLKCKELPLIYFKGLKDE